jgi:hypothetical protein
MANRNALQLMFFWAFFSLFPNAVVHAQALAPLLDLVCESGSPCLPSLAILSTGENICFGFLAEDGALYTSSHCLDADLRQPHTPCGERVSIQLSSGNGYESVPLHCEEVEWATEVNDPSHPAPLYWLAMDVARLKVTAPADQRPGMHLSSDGFADASSYTIPHLQIIHGRRETQYGYSLQTCQARQGTLTLPSFAYDTAPLALMVGCQIEQGDSGAPVIDTSGAVHGVNYAAFHFPRWSVHRSLPDHDLPMGTMALIDGEEAPPAPVAWITNLACLATNTCTMSPQMMRSLERSALASFASHLSFLGEAAHITLDSARHLRVAMPED